MRTGSFSLLVMVCLAVLLGLRFGLERLAPALAADAASVAPTEPGAVMAVPPKPEGLGDAPAGEGDGPAAILTASRCEAMPAELRDTCFQALARQQAGADPDGALAVCARLSEQALLEECHADVAESIAVMNRTRSESICAGIASVKWRGQCNFGIGLALAETDAEYAVARCAHAEVYQTFCRHDVVGEIALVDLAAAQTICAREEGDWLTQKTCWHGIKYLARRSAAEAIASCAATTPAWMSNCFHGVGWGAAERDPDAALAACETVGEWSDNCRHGVANQLKRADPQRAVALCESISKSETRARCLEFVTR